VARLDVHRRRNIIRGGLIALLGLMLLASVPALPCSFFQPPSLSSPANTGPPHGAINYANAELIPRLPSFLSLGYSPSTLSSLADGIPVYSLGDQLWVESRANQTVGVGLSAPDGTPIITINLPPNSAQLLFEFHSYNAEGNWSIQITGLSQYYAFHVLVVNPSNHGVGIALNSYSIQNGQMDMGFSRAPSQAYNIQACLTGAQASSALSTIQTALPSGLGSGSALFSWNGSFSTVTIRGSVAQTFTVWYELYYTYSYTNLNTNQFVSRQVLVAKTTPQIFDSQGTSNATVQTDVVLRTGRYGMRVYFGSAQGLSISSTQVLVLNPDGDWIWLNSCSPFAITGESSSFQRSANLSGQPSQWPSTMYLMYVVSGVDMVSTLPLNVLIARVDFAGSPGNVALEGVDLDAQATGAGSNATALASSSGDSVYVAATGFPVQLTVTPVFGNLTYQSQTITLSQPFQVYKSTIPIGRVSVVVRSNGAPLRSASVFLLYGNSTLLTELTGSDGTVTFYPPPGPYNVRVLARGSEEERAINVTAGLTSTVSFDFTLIMVPEYLTFALVATLAIGMIANVYLWVIRPRRSAHIV